MFSSASLDAFLNSSMNVELVYMILLGINQFMQNLGEDRWVPGGAEDLQNKITIKQDKRNTKIDFHRIKFEDI
jgi:hypothetical protein